MSAYTKEFKQLIHQKIDEIFLDEIANIERAADLIISSIVKDRLVYVFGTGHSMLMGMEMFTRAGGLVQVSPMFDLSLSGFSGGLRATYLERLPGYAKALLDYYSPAAGSTLIVVSSSGKNAAPVEMAIEARKRGIKVIALTSIEYSKSVPAANPAGKKLFEVADVVIDTKVPAGDAALQIEGLEQKVASISTVLDAYVLETLVVVVVEKMLSMGLKPSIWMEPNVPGGDEFNKQYLDKYFKKIKPL